MTKVFVDGSAGTTGLKIFDRLSLRDDIELITIPDNYRKDIEYRKKAINSSDVTFLCLPDDAAIESASLVENDRTVLIDTSTAHRTNKDWVYGFAELEGQRQLIKNAKKIANPGCHASGFISLINPLVKNGLLNKDVQLSCFSITGYTGGGKKMIAKYENEKIESYMAPRQYGLSQKHKHLPEMKIICDLEYEPCFIPVVSNFPCGMEVTIPLFKKDVNGTIEDIKSLYSKIYNTKIVHYDENVDEEGFLSSNVFSEKDDMQICVYGNEDRIILVSRFDNLGKGASGAAIQNMNIVLGIDEEKGLNI